MKALDGGWDLLFFVAVVCGGIAAVGYVVDAGKEGRDRLQQEEMRFKKVCAAAGGQAVFDGQRLQCIKP
jgi:hypothetical protein